MNPVQPSSVNCIICLESLSSKYVTLECNHLLDISCQQQNIIKRNLTCPLCRADIRNVSSVHGISLAEFSSIKLDKAPDPRLSNIINESETQQDSLSEQPSGSTAQIQVSSSESSISQTRPNSDPASNLNRLTLAWNNQFDRNNKRNVVSILNACFDYSQKKPRLARGRILDGMLPLRQSYSNRFRVTRSEERKIIESIFLNSDIQVNRKITENDIPNLLR